MSELIDTRARIGPKTDTAKKYVFGDAFSKNDTSHVLYPLLKTNGLIFPYTPTVNISATAEYESKNFTQNNYSLNSWQYSRPAKISINGTFTASTQDEANYSFAAIHFLRSHTKGTFGQQKNFSVLGSPPIVLLFNYGGGLYKNIPVIITEVSINLPNDVDYVSCRDNTATVPVKFDISVTLDVQYAPSDMVRNFGLENFVNGEYLDKGKFI